MTIRDIENKEIQRELENADAGVADLLAFYDKVEGIYVSASQASPYVPSVTASSATNTE